MHNQSKKKKIVIKFIKNRETKESQQQNPKMHKYVFHSVFEYTGFLPFHLAHLTVCR